MASTSAAPNTQRGDPDSAQWWAGISAGEIRLPTCRRCGRKWFPPSPTCPHCGAAEHTLEIATGRGTVYSWVVVHRTFDQALAAETPYVIVAIDLSEGVRVVGRLRGSASGLGPGAAVRAVIYGAPAGPLLGFELVSG